MRNTPISCKMHLNPLETCNKCLLDLVNDQKNIIYNLMERQESVWAAFPSRRDTLLEIENAFPLTFSKEAYK
jgi:hypothetical protein